MAPWIGLSNASLAVTVIVEVVVPVFAVIAVGAALTVERAAVLAAYMQSLARYILTERPLAPSRDVYALYNYNRFQACRYGLAGQLVDAYSRRRVVIREDILDMIRVIARHAGELGAAAALEQLAAGVAADGSDARWLRESYRSHGSLNDVARMQSELWMGSALVSA